MNWKKTWAFTVLSGGQGCIRLNVKGREAQGILNRNGAQYDTLVEVLKQSFESLEDSTGKRLVKTVVVVKDAFPGRFADQLPDLSVVWNDMPPATQIHSEELGNFTGRIQTGRGGNHRPNAFVWVSGAASEQLPKTPAHIVELPDTIRLLLARGIAVH